MPFREMHDTKAMGRGTMPDVVIRLIFLAVMLAKKRLHGLCSRMRYRGSVLEVSTTVHPFCSPSTQALPAVTESTGCVKDQPGLGGAVNLNPLLKSKGGGSFDDIFSEMV